MAEDSRARTTLFVAALGLQVVLVSGAAVLFLHGGSGAGAHDEARCTAMIEDLLATVESERARRSEAERVLRAAEPGFHAANEVVNENARLAKDLAEASGDRETLLGLLAHARAPASRPAERTLEPGKVIVVGKETLVVALGADRGLEVGLGLTVYQGGDPIADVQVSGVLGEACACRIVSTKEGARPRAGDLAVARTR